MAAVKLFIGRPIIKWSTERQLSVTFQLPFSGPSRYISATFPSDEKIICVIGMS